MDLAAGGGREPGHADADKGRAASLDFSKTGKSSRRGRGRRRNENAGNSLFRSLRQVGAADRAAASSCRPSTAIPPSYSASATLAEACRFGRRTPLPLSPSHHPRSPRPRHLGCILDCTVEPDDGAVEHRVGDDVLDEVRELARTAEPAGNGPTRRGFCERDRAARPASAFHMSPAMVIPRSPGSRDLGDGQGHAHETRLRRPRRPPGRSAPS